ncbi:unnamed protein product [Phaeothamnion confervicola]
MRASFCRLRYRGYQAATFSSHRREEPRFTACRKEVLTILDKALSQTGASVTPEEGAVLLSTSGCDLRAVCTAADELRYRANGNVVSFVINRNINFTNACVRRCGFCAFSRVGAGPEAYFLPLPEIVRRAIEAVEEFGATEICVQAGLPPVMPRDLYVEVASAIKAAVPKVHLHAFSPEEVDYGAARAGASIRDFLRLLKAAGVDSLPGTSAEILDDGIRAKLGRRLSAGRWLEIVRTAHEEGLPTTATMMFGHIETPWHVAAHLETLRDLQRETGGISEFVPLSFVAAEAPAFREKSLPELRAGPTGREVLAVHAVSRILLDGAVRNIQVSWPKEGMRMAQALLDCGVNDLGGTLMNESITTSAGAMHGQLMRPAAFRAAIADAGRVAVQRDTRYNVLATFPAVADATTTAAAAPADGDDDAESYSAASVSEYATAGASSSALDRVPDGDGERIFGSYRKLVQSPDHRFKDRFGRRGRSSIAAGNDGSAAGQQSRSFTALAGKRRWEKRRADAARIEMTGGAGGIARREAAAPTVVTFSSSYTIVPTYECFNICTYCNFRTDLSGSGEAAWLRLDAAAEKLAEVRRRGWRHVTAAAAGGNSAGAAGPAAASVSGSSPAATGATELGSRVREVLVMSGEIHPASRLRPAWIRRVRELCELALSLGFQPHTNVGPLSRSEMEELAVVNASMGLMLEQCTPLLAARGGVHRWAPSKRPELRLRQLRQAGELRVPFTTGVLVGVGEEGPGDSFATLEAIAAAARHYGHVQECIIQPYSPGTRETRKHAAAKAPRGAGNADGSFGSDATACSGEAATAATAAASSAAGASNAATSAVTAAAAAEAAAVAAEEAGEAALEQLAAVVAAARALLPAEVVVQVPPNLIRRRPDVLRACLAAGSRDLGGMSPLDEVNPDYAFPSAPELAALLQREGYELRERDAVHARFRGWLPERVRAVVDAGGGNGGSGDDGGLLFESSAGFAATLIGGAAVSAG